MASYRGEKELKHSYDEATEADSTKAIGHIKNLIPERGSNADERRVHGS
jgi:hypothetical protein